MRKPRLVVIDDDGAFARRVAEVARRTGFEATACSNGHEFMTICEETSPDAVVLELVLQDLDGFQLVRWLIDRESAARIIVISAYNPSYARAAEVLARQQGKMSLTYVEKPIDDRTLRATLRATLKAIRADRG